MKLVRRLVLASLSYNILFKAKHIPGNNNESIPNSNTVGPLKILTTVSHQLLASASPSTVRAYRHTWEFVYVMETSPLSAGCSC